MLVERLDALTTDTTLQAFLVLSASFVLAFLVEVLFRGVLQIFVQNTKTHLDDVIVANLRRPIFLSVIFVGLDIAVDLLEPHTWLDFVVTAGLVSVAILLWTGALIRISAVVLIHLGDRADATGVLQPRTLPLFTMLAKIVLASAAVYMIMVAWGLDLTGWLASAGIVGIAVGFAAKDSLANLFAGIFIIADAPYKLGDFIMFEDGLRGRVTEIGLRATRILTRDDIEINIPNQLIGNSRVVNESAGPHEKERVLINVSAAYGCDVDVVRKVLLECPKGQPWVCEQPAPHVLFRLFGGSGLEFSLCVWIQQPRHKEDVIDILNTRIYKAFAAAGLEIPYSKHDVYIKDMPPAQLLPAVVADPAVHNNAAAPVHPAPPPNPHPAPVTPQAAATHVAHILGQQAPALLGPPRRYSSGTPG